MHLAWSPHDEAAFATVGKDHMMLCAIAGSGKATKVSKKRGQAKGGSLVSQSSIVWSPDSKYKAVMFSGGADGKIYQWSGASVTKTYSNSKGAVQSMAVARDGQQDQVLAGGHDKTVTIYTFKGGSLSKSKQVVLAASPRSLDFYDGEILCGLKNGSIVALQLANAGEEDPFVAM